MRRAISTLLVLALVLAGAAVWRYDLVERWLGPDAAGDDPAAIAPPPGLDLPAVLAPGEVAAPARAGALSPPAVRRALRPYLGDPDLGRHVLAAVAPLGSGRTVTIGEGAAVPASTTKVVTSAAALLALGPDRTFDTTVVRAGPRRVVLVGGGDPLLARGPADPGEAAPYPPRADVEDLASRTAATLRRQGVRKVALEYDAGLFTGPSASPHWEPDYVPDGVVSPISSLWVDEGRPADGPGRVADPALAAAQAFAAALARAGVQVTGAPAPGTAPRSGTPIARVASAPLWQLVERVLLVSDNEAAEVLLRHVGLAVQGEGSFEAGRRGVVRVLEEAGVALPGTTLYDGSGLSRRSRMTPAALIDVLRLATRRPELEAVLGGLPVAGFTGSLADRFVQGPVEGRGRVRAKTGTLTGVASLAGVATDVAGRPMLFVLMADRVKRLDATDAEVALDAAAAALGACRCG
ncbi:D-alanyl-D-alanine carboxypeptidase/D-alanyl-D-alanine-endopeptidase [Nocardioides sp. cx-169]|uniref:D-alanyl-D-alanine carboxypeptidase/D-alanyl-D-alanine endopeptidase n=1 Tax=Nocardioides sp. cx-169 TaxID=2899080 RepID=UPI001E33AB09|nr:D-alanyl-D-alanine carboxypeptidase/D-alanyl-D-alanine-endopeptidase [Nocardioides sp. cx-169]MCD4532651.1 D-alanyl-D-alanine carboxypeptidase/D-alanyl-D-alanine-endopeptidase [Nocardioides sp. cx-169]